MILLVAQKPSGFICLVILGDCALMLCDGAVGRSGSTFICFRCFGLMAALPEKDPCLGHVAAHRKCITGFLSKSGYSFFHPVHCVCRGFVEIWLVHFHPP